MSLINWRSDPGLKCRPSWSRKTGALGSFAKLHGAQTGIDQREDDRLVSMAKTQAHGEAPAVAGAHLARVDAGFEHALDFFLQSPMCSTHLTRIRSYE